MFMVWLGRKNVWRSLAEQREMRQRGDSWPVQPWIRAREDPAARRLPYFALSSRSGPYP